MNKGLVILLAAAMSGVLVTALPVQESKTPGVTKRQANQQKRIRSGAKSGELTRTETRRVEAEQTKIAADKRKAKSDGTVTKEERKQLHKEQNKASRDIYRQKHDAQKKPGAK